MTYYPPADGPGLGVDEIKAKYEDPRYDLLRDDNFMSVVQWEIWSRYLETVIVNAVTTCDLSVVEKHWPTSIPKLAWELFADALRSEAAIRQLINEGF